MSLFSLFYSTILDALFPLSQVEKELLSLSPEDACKILPPAPQTPIPETGSIFAYKDERVAKLVWNIKYKKSPVAISIGGYVFYQKLLTLNLPERCLIIPIPITRRRRRERGFNQCELLLEEIARLDSANRFVIANDLLIRTQHADRQTLKARSERLESAKGIFSVNNEVAEQFKDYSVVIIDDVITTGSTIREAAETLQINGFRNVKGLSLAH